MGFWLRACHKAIALMTLVEETRTSSRMFYQPYYKQDLETQHGNRYIETEEHCGDTKRIEDHRHHM